MNSPVEELEITDLAYVAGIIDGEGSISVFLNSQKGAKCGFTFIPCLTIVNTNLQMLQRVQKIFALLGARSRIRLMPHRPRRRDCYRMCQYSAYQIMKILPYVIPYMIVKRRSAELLFAYLVRRASRLRESGTKGARYTVAEMKFVKSLRSEIAGPSGKVWNRNPRFDPRLDEAIRQLLNPN
jgi:LAGLIDADG-like domain